MLAVWLAVLCLWAGGYLPAMAHWRQLAADGLTVCCCCGYLCLACPLTQGLADTFLLLGMPFDSSEAAQLNKEIFETIYYASLETSCHLAKEQGPYETYEGSPVSKGVLQHDMWGVKVRACRGGCCLRSLSLPLPPPRLLCLCGQPVALDTADFEFSHHSGSMSVGSC